MLPQSTLRYDGLTASDRRYAIRQIALAKRCLIDAESHLTRPNQCGLPDADNHTLGDSLADVAASLEAMLIGLRSAKSPRGWESCEL